MKVRGFTLTVMSLAVAIVSQHAQALTSTERQLLEQIRILSEKVAELERKANAGNVVNTQALDQKVRVLERKLELADAEAVKVRETTPIITANEKGFSIASPGKDKDFEIKFRGLVQADARLFQDEANGEIDDFLLRRVRPTIEGTVFKNYDFKITADFGNNSTALVDAYVDARLAGKAAALRVGKFIPPLGLEHLQGSSNTKFIENSLPSNFSPSRDVGVQLHGKLVNNTIDYALGVFNGAVDGSSGDKDNNTDKDIAARIFLSPFINGDSLLQGLSFGVAASRSDAKGVAGSTNLPSQYRTPGQQTIFSYNSNVVGDGQRDRFIPQFTFYNGGFGLQGEFASVKQDVTHTGTSREDTLSHDAWALTASYLLTGEEASFRGVKPKNTVGNGGWGAWELIARMSELDIDQDAFVFEGGALGVNTNFANGLSRVQQASNWGVGVNWYLNSVIRSSLTYEETRFDLGGGGTALSPLDREDEKLLIGRLQASF